MAASLLIPPADWQGYTYMEIVRMLWQATGERLKVSAPDAQNTFPNQTQKLDYMTYLRNISSAIKSMLNEQYSGFSNPAFDPLTQPFPPTFVTADMIWNEADMLAEIGDPFIYDFSENGYNGVPTAFFDFEEGYRQGVDTGMPPYLVQYYEIITRLKMPIIDWQLAKDREAFGLWDEGITNDPFQNRERTPGSNSSIGSRRLNYRIEGQQVGDTYDAPFNDPYEPWPAVQADHDADYGLIYQFPPNTGSSRPGGVGTVLQILTSNTTNIFTDVRVKFLATANDDPIDGKTEQIATYGRLRQFVDYQNFNVGALAGINGRPRDVKWLAYTLNEDDGDLGNPYLTNQLFFVPQNFTGNVADVIYLGDHPGRGGPPNPAAGTSEGFTYYLWQCTIFEDWDYEGGYDYYTP